MVLTLPVSEGARAQVCMDMWEGISECLLGMAFCWDCVPSFSAKLMNN